MQDGEFSPDIAGEEKDQVAKKSTPIHWKQHLQACSLLQPVSGGSNKRLFIAGLFIAILR